MKQILLTLTLLFLTVSAGFSQGFDHFITRDGAQLMDGEEVYRFISFNIPNLNYVEDEMKFTETNPYDLPTEFEMRDAFETVKQMGGRVIRIYTIPVKNNNFPEDAPTYVEAPGEFNEEAFETLDLMMALANEYEVRIIFSLLNNWQWMGGAPNYADFRGKTRDDFWTDEQLKDDFKKTITFVLNRENTVTGQTYKNDKAIMAWETGNELYSPHEWTVEMVKHIKEIDPNHLVMDGFFASDSRPVREEAVEEDLIDIVTSHHYEREPDQLLRDIQTNLDVVQGRKPYFLGEFGFLSTAAIERILDKVIDTPDISGALIWSLRYRHRDGGFYFHSEPLGAGLYKSYHWPGFESGESYDEKNLMQMYRRKAFEIQNKVTPEIPVPKAPTLLPIENVADISWQGTVGTVSYIIQRSEQNNGPWKTIAYDVSEAAVQYTPLYHDETATIGKSYFYRVIAQNGSGQSEPSNVVGPVEVEKQSVIDHMTNFGKVWNAKNVSISTGNDRTFKEDIHRMAGTYGSRIYYHIPGKLDEMKIYSFEEQNWAQLLIYTSSDGSDWERIHPEITSYGTGESNYNYWTPQLYRIDGAEVQPKYIKIGFRSDVELSRVEIFYKN